MEHEQREKELRALNEQLDRQKEALVKQFREAAEGEEQLPAPECNDDAVTDSGADTEGLKIDEELEPLEDDEAFAMAADVSESDATIAHDTATARLAGRSSAALPQLPPPALPGLSLVGTQRPSSRERGDRDDLSHAGAPPTIPPDATDGTASSAMGSEASARYQKAQLAVTLEELERLRSALAAKAVSAAEAEASARDLRQRVSKLERSERALQASLEREKQASSEAQARAERLEREVSLARKASDESVRREKSSGSEQRTKDIRLNRALEELERTKAALRVARDEREDAGSEARGEAARLAAENARLLKRQSELLLAFKKQAKLLDILKRQKLHVEAATMLSFTEEEFARTLELGEALA